MIETIEQAQAWCKLRAVSFLYKELAAKQLDTTAAENQVVVAYLELQALLPGTPPAP